MSSNKLGCLSCSSSGIYLDFSIASHHSPTLNTCVNVLYSTLFSFISFAQRIYKYARVKIAPKILTKHLDDELFCEKS